MYHDERISHQMFNVARVFIEQLSEFLIDRLEFLLAAGAVTKEQATISHFRDVSEHDGRKESVSAITENVGMIRTRDYLSTVIKLCTA